MALVAPAIAQNDSANYAQTVVDTLESAGLTTLASALSLLQATPDGQAFFDELQDDEKTVFAPTNEAFTSAGFPEDLSSAGDIDVQSLFNTLLYHIVDEDLTDDDGDIPVSPSHSVSETLLTGSAGGNIQFPNGTSVPLILARDSQDSDTFTILGTASNITVSAQPTEAANLQIYTIDQIISLPPSLAELAEAAGLTQLATVLSDQGLLETLNSSTSGLTIFAPNDAAFEAISETLGGLSDEQVVAILQNHVVNGTVAFSDDIADAINDDDDDDDNNDDQIVPLAGPAFTFMSNDTGIFVMSGSASAQIVSTDNLFNGGVVHVIDSVLVNEDPQVNEPTQSGGGGGSPSQTSSNGGGSQTSTPAGGDGNSEEDNGNGAGQLVVSWATLGVVSLGALVGGGVVAF